MSGTPRANHRRWRPASPAGALRGHLRPPAHAAGALAAAAGSGHRQPPGQRVHGTDDEALHEQWADQARSIGYEPERVAANAVGTELNAQPIDHVSRSDVAAAALRALAESQSTWRAAEVVRELAAAVPPSVTEEPGRLLAWLDELAADVINVHMVELTPPVPDGVPLRRDGRPVSESVLNRA